MNGQWTKTVWRRLDGNWWWWLVQYEENGQPVKGKFSQGGNCPNHATADHAANNVLQVAKSKDETCPNAAT